MINMVNAVGEKMDGLVVVFVRLRSWFVSV